MHYKFIFSCQETKISLAYFMSDGYGVWFDRFDGATIRIDIGENNRNVVSLLSPDNTAALSQRKTTCHYWLEFEYNPHTTPDNYVIIPAQTHAVYESDIHPLDEKHIFPHFSNVVIGDIELTDHDHGYEIYRYSSESDLVLDLLLTQIPSHIRPLSQKWIDVYQNTKEAAHTYIQQQNKEAMDYMASLINNSQT